MTAEELLAALVAKADAGEIPPKQAGTIRHLAGRVAAGKDLTEMQEELLREFALAAGIE